jgi:hypothetical protein
MTGTSAASAAGTGASLSLSTSTAAARSRRVLPAIGDQDTGGRSGWRSRPSPAAVAYPLGGAMAHVTDSRRHPGRWL